MVLTKLNFVFTLTLTSGLVAACGGSKGGGSGEEAGQALETITAPVVSSDQPTSGTTGGIGGIVLPGSRTPPTPTITTPATATYVSGGSSLTIAGACETGDIVTVEGDGQAQTTCSNGAYTTSIAKTTDGTYTFLVKQTDAGKNVSGSASVKWTRDTALPAAPALSLPATNPRHTRGNSLTIAGACVTGNTVTLAGLTTAEVTSPAGILVQPCNGATFSYTVAKSVDGTYDFTVTQTSAANGLTSSPSTVTWVRDTVDPVTPTITSPASSPYLSNAALTIEGACETDATVILGGNVSTSEMLTPAGKISLTCAASAYRFVVSKSSDGVFNFTVSQADRAGNASGLEALQWQLDSTSPAAPTVATPATNPYHSSGSALTVSGGCESGATVTLGGNVVAGDVSSPAGSLTQACSSSSYSFTVGKASDATYTFTVSQRDTANNLSASAASIQWVRDTALPATPTISSPASSPHYSGGSLTLVGGCETGTTVKLGGDVIAGDVTTPPSTLSQSCVAAAYSFTISKSGSTTYNLTVSQTDRAGNDAAVAATFQWVRDTTAPSAPTITAPASSPHYSNTGSVTVTGACETNATVYLSGNVVAGDVSSPAGSLSQACASNLYSFTVAKSTQSTFTLTVGQTDGAGNASATTSTQWVRDTAAPSAPSVISPATSTYTSGGSSITIAGACETGATVTLAGEVVSGDVTVPSNSLTLICSASAYSFSVTKNADDVYDFSLTQTDRAGNSSTATAQQWTRNNSMPGTPTITTPASNPLHANGASVTIAGDCTTGYRVDLGGDVVSGDVTAPAGSLEFTCASSAYSFTVAKSTQATFTFNVTQTNLAGPTTSAAASVQWVRDTSAPAAPSVTVPAASPIFSSDDSLTISGSCETDAVVAIGGEVVSGDLTTPAGSLTRTCVGGAYSFILAKTSDDTYDLTVAQTDRAGNASSSTAVQWIRDTVDPAAPTVTTPAATPVASGAGSIIIAGACESDATVTLGGNVIAGNVTSPAGSLTQTCTASAYSFTVAKSVDGTYDFTVAQTDRALNASSTTTQRWVRDSVAPAAPVISSPASTPHSTNGNNVTISGTCESGATVTLSGADSQTATCSVGSTFSFTVTKADDGTYDFSVTQADAAGNPSGAATLRWIRDTVAPASPTITNPGVSPVTSGDSVITIAGGCEAGNTVTLAGASAQSATCSGGSAYSFSVSKGTDGTYDFTVAQSDAVGNSSATRALRWIRDTNVPAAPTVTAPAATPYYSKTSSLTISGACVTGHDVSLGGDVTAAEVTSPAGVLIFTCASSAYSFTLSKSSPGTYSFGVSQENTTTNYASAETQLTWIYDTSVPSVPTVVSPSTNPYTSSGNYTIEGSCEAFATVNIAGDGTASTTCTTLGTYSLTVVKSVDMTYNFTVSQTDRAGNASTTLARQWVRNSALPATPTIVSPTDNPYEAATTDLTISGGCTTGLVVTMSGNVVSGDVQSPAGSLTTTCSNSSFSFTIRKTIDGTYDLTFKQTSAGTDSGTVTQRWIRDAAPPQTTIDSRPEATNLSLTAVYTFSCNEATCTFECSLDSAAYAACSSPLSYVGLSNASHSFEVRAKDGVGNIDATPDSDTWTQSAYNAVALYHLNTNTATAFDDSSSYSGAANNVLTDNSSTTSAATGKFAEGRTLNGTTGFLPALTTASQDVLATTMSVEGFVKFGTLPSNGAEAVIASKTGASGNYGWELKIARQGAKYFLKFSGSLNGTTVTTLKSANITAPSTTAFTHFAVTWNSGSVKFFVDGVQKGTGTIGTAGTAKLFATTADLRIGRHETGSYLDGVVDEVRLSQVLRWSANFTPPTSAYAAD